MDIWSLEPNKSTQEIINNENLFEENASQNKIYKMQSEKTDGTDITEDLKLISKEIEIIGLYDPDENGLDINMWVNSDGDQILKLFQNINKMDLSNDATEILDILLLTNSYFQILIFQEMSLWKSNLIG